MPYDVRRSSGIVGVLLLSLSACSSGGSSKTGAAGGGGTAGTTGAAGAAAAGNGGAGAAGTSASGTAGVGAAGVGAAGAGSGGVDGGSAGASGPTDAGTGTDAPTTTGAGGATGCAHGAISLSANGTGNDSDAAHSHVVIDLMADMPLGNTPRTIEFWFYVKPTDWLAEKNEILFYGALNGGTKQVIGLDFGNPPVVGMPTNHATLNPWTDGVYDDDSGKDLGITSTVTQWVHVAIVWDMTALRTYVNGVERITGMTTPAQPLTTLAGLFYVGCLPLNFSCFNGLFDELRVWNVARTADQIMANYDKGLVGNETGLVGYWKFDDAPGSTMAADSVTTAGHTAHPGTLMSATDAGAPTFVTPDPPSPVACP